MGQSQTTNTIFVSAIRAFTDNYIWAITSSASNHLTLVDPGDAKVCIEYIKQNNKILSSILITHHHNDHTGGIDELIAYNNTNNLPLTIYAPKNNSIHGVTYFIGEDDLIELAEHQITFSVLALPGHTLDHIAYLSDDILFCGDTLFSGGCGRIFEGTPMQMHQSLTKLKHLPERTRVYCTHEYTLSNLEFALTVEPSNLELIHYYNQVVALREHDHISLPSSILREKLINPFLRCDNPEIKESVREYYQTEQSTELNNEISIKNIPQDELTTFTNLRLWKNSF